MYILILMYIDASFCLDDPISISCYFYLRYCGVHRVATQSIHNYVFLCISMHYFDYMISFIVRDIYIACVVGYVAYLKKNYISMLFYAIINYNMPHVFT